MIFKRVNRTDAERVFVVFQANEASIAADDVVGLELAAASVDGVKISQVAATEEHATVGVADAAIANGSYGLVQVYGYRSTSRINTTGATLTPGVALGAVAGADYLETKASIAPPWMPIFTLLESAASTGTTATVSKKIFIRAM
jgi:hypothetical protein